jgi:S-adenosylmethionine:tRNA ribosyltransferase-isomerase
LETLKDYDYDLPPEMIAQVPAAQRAASRLLVLDRAGGAVRHARFCDLPGLLRPGDVLVLNDTRVIPARLEALRSTGGRVELFLLEPATGASEPAAGAGGARGAAAGHTPRSSPPEPGRWWRALAKSSGRLKAGEALELVRGGRAVLEEFHGGGEWRVSFEGMGAGADLFEKGRMPLPHYIRREWASDPSDGLDRERYQTVYAARDGAVAAPTAGLHFTPEVFERLEAAGVERVFLTLHVGVGTFAPVREKDFRNHVMHAERYTLSEEAAAAVNAARRRGGRIVAVGTTSARVLETVAAEEGAVRPGSGSTGIYIHPPYRFRAVDALVTNFHLPRSTLLLLVSAFAGRERILGAYAEAVARRYRFYSYGDAMLIL